MTTAYQQAKESLKRAANWVKKAYPKDKPMIRQTINDTADSLFREFKLTEHQMNLLSEYACKLHPKN